jgi:hypothetical protein
MGILPMDKISEHGAQVALIKTTNMHTGQRPELALLFAVPNGGKRDKRTAAKLKAEGVRAGVPDLCLPVARGVYHGLFIEMKVGRNKAEPEQLWWIEQLTRQGYYCQICYDWSKAMEILIDYLDGRIAQ